MYFDEYMELDSTYQAKYMESSFSIKVAAVAVKLLGGVT
jgi:hypothetical protein